jgi:RNA polymerase sigma-70 factor, ECF subfamily
MTFMDDRAFKTEMIALVPRLRAFAISLTGKSHAADDLLQETLMKAWAHRDSYEPGTNMKAWLYTILRNEFYTVIRKRKREVEDADGKIAERVGVLPGQESYLDLLDMQKALQLLPPDQREALLLVSASDMSYEEASVICKVAVGTIKSRVNRARERLAGILQGQTAAEFGSSPSMHAALAAKPSLNHQ